MKKSKIWIHVCVHLLLFISLEVYSISLDAGNVNAGIVAVKDLRQNIPIDYKINITYMPKDEAGMCWITLNVFYLEESLNLLSKKFGDKASNKDDISKLVLILQGLRINIKTDLLEEVLMNYQCHYQNSAWHRERYFDFVEDFLKSALKNELIDDCDDPPPCPSTQQPAATNGPTTVPQSHCPNLTCVSNCSRNETPPLSKPNCEKNISEGLKQSLFSLLFIPLMALIVLLVWRVRSRRNEDVERNPGEDRLFTGTEGTAPPPNGEISERNNLNVSETV